MIKWNNKKLIKIILQKNDLILIIELNKNSITQYIPLRPPVGEHLPFKKGKDPKLYSGKEIAVYSPPLFKYIIIPEKSP